MSSNSPSNNPAPPCMSRTYAEHIKGLYGLWQMRSMTTTKAMTMVQSASGMTVRLNTSSPSVTGSDDDAAAAPAFFLVILATSSPSPLLRILQLLLQKLPCTLKLGTTTTGVAV